MKAGPLLLAAWLSACAAWPRPGQPPIGVPPVAHTATLSQPQTHAPTLQGTTPTPNAPSATRAPTAAPAPVLMQLTAGGCCTQPFFAPDGSQVRFIDRPGPDSPAGIWGVPVSGGEPQFISARPAYYSLDGQYLVYPEDNQTYIERAATGERWIPSLVEGRFVSISPDSARIAWQVNSSAFSFDRRAVDIWVAGIDGANPHQVARLVGGNLGQWFPDSQRVLITRREAAGGEPILAILNVVDGAITDLVQSRNLRGGSLSPGGGWVAYQVTFTGDPAQDGLWVMPTDGDPPVRLPLYGPYRWRTEGNLLVIPFEYSQAGGSHRLVEVEAAAAEARALTDPALLPFRVANGDWVVSPDGRQVVFLSADDRNLWLLDLAGL